MCSARVKEFFDRKVRLFINLKQTLKRKERKQQIFLLQTNKNGEQKRPLLHYKY
jgi:hypothetical protein